jgi:hypothetical protein
MNLSVDFTREAVKDLSDIASYTAETWGREQVFSYAELLDGHFKEIAKGQIYPRLLFQSIPMYTCVDVSSLYFLCASTREFQACDFGNIA